MWLVIGKIFYDGSCFFRGLVWLLLAFAFAGACYELWGWIGLIGFIISILLFAFAIWYSVKHPIE